MRADDLKERLRARLAQDVQDLALALYVALLANIESAIARANADARRLLILFRFNVGSPGPQTLAAVADELAARARRRFDTEPPRPETRS